MAYYTLLRERVRTGYRERITIRFATGLRMAMERFTQGESERRGCIYSTADLVREAVQMFLAERGYAWKEIVNPRDKH